MTTIRSHTSIPYETARRVQAVRRAARSNDRPPRAERKVGLPVPVSPEPEQRSHPLHRPVPPAAEVVVQLMAGHPARGLKAEPSEQHRYRETYARIADYEDTSPILERRA